MLLQLNRQLFRSDIQEIVNLATQKMQWGEYWQAIELYQKAADLQLDIVNSSEGYSKVKRLSDLARLFVWGEKYKESLDAIKTCYQILDLMSVADDYDPTLKPFELWLKAELKATYQVADDCLKKDGITSQEVCNSVKLWLSGKGKFFIIPFRLLHLLDLPQEMVDYIRQSSPSTGERRLSMAVDTSVRMDCYRPFHDDLQEYSRWVFSSYSRGMLFVPEDRFVVLGLVKVYLVTP